MPQFNVGDIVIYVNSNEKGVVTEVCPPSRGRQMYKVSIDNSIRNCLESNLMADIDLSDPFKRLVLLIIRLQNYLKNEIWFPHTISNQMNSLVFLIKASYSPQVNLLFCLNQY